MANQVTNYGLQRIGVQASQATAASGPSFSSTRHIQVMSVDASTFAFAATDDALNDGGAFVGFAAVPFDAAPGRTSQTVSHIATFTTGLGNFTISRLGLHDASTVNVSTASVTFCAGVDGQSFVKTSNMTITFTLNMQYTT